MTLTKYNQKRDFKSTSEPEGKVKNINSNRFVIQYHKARTDHYDFRLEHNGVLLSWAVPKGLSNNPKVKRLAVKVEDHPVDYISFEGIIPDGNYGAGTVEIFDSGNYMPLIEMDKALKKGHIKIVLNGDKIKGGWHLVKTEDDQWLIFKMTDEFMNSKTNKIANLPFKNHSAQLATLSNHLPKGEKWIYEIKYDGYRISAYKEKNKITLFSRNNMNYTSKFHTISEAISKIDATNFVLDGEVVSFDKTGRSDFGLLQKNLKTKNEEFYYVIFDLLALNGEDLRDHPLIKRKEKLERLLHKVDPVLIYSSHVTDGKKMWEFAKDKELEGVIAKKIDSKYSGTRSEDWLKIKCYNHAEFVVAGYTTSDKNEELASLLLGFYQDDELVFIGKVGTGFSDETRTELRKLFKPHTRKTSPFALPPKEKNVVWVSPNFVAEVQYAEITKDNRLRQPSFMGLRSDKSPKEVAKP